LNANIHRRYHKNRHWTSSYANVIQFTSPYRYILILLHLHEGVTLLDIFRSTFLVSLTPQEGIRFTIGQFGYLVKSGSTVIHSLVIWLSQVVQSFTVWLSG